MFDGGYTSGYFSSHICQNRLNNNLDITKADDRKVAENLQYLCQTVLETQGSRQWIHVSTCRDDSRNRQTCMTLKR